MPKPETERQRTERLLNELLAEAQAAESAVEESRRFLLSGLFSKKRPSKTRPAKTPGKGVASPAPGVLGVDWPSPPQAQFPKPAKKSDRRSDLVLAALGVTLGLICALFPWYIFYNDIRFSTHGFKLGGKGERNGRIVVSSQPLDVAPLQPSDMAARNLDLFATGTPAERPEDPDKAPGLDQQPFPAENAEFQLVHVANGRAMIEDNAGLWIVQPGSMLPDNSKVASIERRGGKWVLVTSTDRVVALTK